MRFLLIIACLRRSYNTGVDIFISTGLSKLRQMRHAVRSFVSIGISLIALTEGLAIHAYSFSSTVRDFLFKETLPFEYIQVNAETISSLKQKLENAIAIKNYYDAALISGRITQLYYLQELGSEAMAQHKVTIGLLKQLTPIQLIHCSFAIQSEFLDINYPVYIAEYSELAFSIAVESNNVEAAAELLGQAAALYWTKNHFPEAMRFFKEFGAYADPFLTINPYDSRDEVIREALLYKDFLRRYIRFMYNAYQSKHRGLCEENNCLQLAWEMTEKIKSRLLRIELLRAGLQRLDDEKQTTAKNLLRKDRELKLRRNFARYSKNDALEVSSYDRQIAELESSISRLIPEYPNLVTNIVLPSEISKVLRPNEVLISYFYTDNERGVYVIKIDHQNATFVPIRLPITTLELFLRIQNLKMVLEKGYSLALLKEELKDYYNLLIKPLDLQPNQRLIIAVDQNLSALPFDIIPWLAPGNQGLMMNLFEINYVPSATVFYHLRKNRIQKGNVEKPYKFDYAGFSFRNQGHTPLYQANTEIENTSAKFLNPLIKLDAKEVDLYKNRERIAGTRYIHLVTHNILENNTGPGIYLSFGVGGGEDGRLTSEEIVRHLKNHAELVALSACETAPVNDSAFQAAIVPVDPKNNPGQSGFALPSGCICSYGESFSNLSGAFFAAGSQRLLLTQWRIRDDDTTEEFIRRFFGFLREGKTPNDALIRTKTMMKDNNYLPLYWAGYIIAGD